MTDLQDSSEMSPELPLARRALLWAATMSATSVLYFGSGHLAGPGTVLPEMGLDRLIEPTLLALPPYLSFFVLILLAFLKAPAARVPQLAAAIVSTAAVAATAFLLYPTTVRFPELGSTGALGVLLEHLRQADTPQNCLPSLHGAFTALCVAVLAPALAGWRRLCLVLWGAAICWSAVALRQHLTVDIAAGVVLGLASAAFWFRPSGHRGSWGIRYMRQDIHQLR